jgi:hypothetical protein
LFASYTGRATLRVGDLVARVMVHVEVRRFDDFPERPPHWTGRLTAGVDARGLFGLAAVLEMPAGRVGHIEFADASGNFTGKGVAPF